jgi:hypothetical protein
MYILLARGVTGLRRLGRLRQVLLQVPVMFLVTTCTWPACLVVAQCWDAYTPSYTYWLPGVWIHMRGKLLRVRRCGPPDWMRRCLRRISFDLYRECSDRDVHSYVSCGFAVHAPRLFN